MISHNGAELIAQVLPIAVFIIAFESRTAIRFTPLGRRRTFLSATSVISLIAAAFGIVVCVAAVSMEFQLEGILALAVAVAFAIVLVGTGIFLDRVLRTMYKRERLDRAET